MNQEKKPTEIIADPKRVQVLPPGAHVEYEEEVESEGEGQKSQGNESLHQLSNSRFARILCLIIFLLSLVGLALGVVIFLGCSFYALIRLLTGDPHWAKALKASAIGMFSVLVFSFCFLVGIFSPRRGINMAIVFSSFAKG